MKKAMTILCLSAMLAFVTACETGGSTARSEQDDKDAAQASRAATNSLGLIPQTRPPFADLPVPIGFKLIEDLSRDHVTAGRRTVDHTYQGRDDKYEVERFYLTQMPLKDWKLMDRKMDGGRFRIRFARPAEQCEIQINDPQSLMGSRTTIHIMVNPISPKDINPQG